MSQSTASKDRWKSKGKSKVSNAPNRLPGVDQRSERARRYRDLCAAIGCDLGGMDALSEARIQLVRRFAMTCIQCEEAEAKMAAGQPVDMQEFLAMASTLVRLANRIGLGRHNIKTVPTLSEYLQGQTLDPMGHPP